MVIGGRSVCAGRWGKSLSKFNPGVDGNMMKFAHRGDRKLIAETLNRAVRRENHINPRDPSVIEELVSPDLAPATSFERRVYDTSAYYPIF